jgi:hypothetical protein
MRAGEARLIPAADSVEGIFDDVMPSDTDGMQKQLPGEGRQAEAGADRAAVEGDAALPGRRRLLPFRDRAAGAIEP